MGTINLNIDPSKEILQWSGGIDSTLGVYLAIRQYGASNLHIFQYARVLEKDVGIRTFAYTEQLKDLLGIDRTKLLSDYRLTYKDMGQDFIPMITDKMKIADKYVMVDFSTENETPAQDRELATHKENIIRHIPIEKHSLLDIRSVFKEMCLDRGEIIELYKEYNIEHLLPLTRSCSVKADVPFLRTGPDLVEFTDEDIENNKHCGVCYKCLKRKYGFKSVGETDPTTYLR